MRTYFKITEHISWDKRNEFTFKGFKQLAEILKALRDSMRLHSDKNYRVIIEEI